VQPSAKSPGIGLERTNSHGIVSCPPLPKKMERLGFALHEFVRTSWVSDAASQVWHPRLVKIVDAWANLEWLSTLAGLRSCAIVLVPPSDFVERAAEWAQSGLHCLPLATQGTPAGFSAQSLPAEAGNTFMYRVVVGLSSEVDKLRHAYDSQDDVGIGRLVGYPGCCTVAYRERWVHERLEDTTWPAAVASGGPFGDGRTIRLRCPPQNNILWRWMGIRAVPHLPCAFTCERSAHLGDDFFRLGRASGYNQEMDWLSEILSWPVEWSALHGIAEIKTPVLKVSTRTDATALKYAVQVEGFRYPAEGAKGLNFPYQSCAPSLGAQLVSIRSSKPKPELGRAADWYWSDNGFSSLTAMNNAHAEIVTLAVNSLSDGNRGPATVLDLGCGNGALLRRIKQLTTMTVPFGIDSRPLPISRSQEILGEYSRNLAVGDMFDCEAMWPPGRRYSLVLLMVGKLRDEPPASAARLKEHLRSSCDRLLVYASDEALARFNQDLSAAAAEVGLRLEEWKDGRKVALARVL